MEADLAELEEELGSVLSWRSRLRKNKLWLQAKKKVTQEEYDSLKDQVEQCREWEELVHGLREGTSWEEVVSGEGVRLARAVAAAEEGSFPLEGGLSGALTCQNCRITFTNAWNLSRHRYHRTLQSIKLYCNVVHFPGTGITGHYTVQHLL